MIRIQIGGAEIELANARNIDENWINDQINKRRRDGLSVCVRVFLRDDTINVSLSSGGCARSGGGGRLPNAEEENVIELWRKVGMDKVDFHRGNLIAFIKQLHRIMV